MASQSAEPWSFLQRHYSTSSSLTDYYAIPISVITVYFVTLIAKFIYRLTLHPLARFPGPFLCRISWLPQCYYEAILDGKFLGKLAEYHREYGPVVRINPNEVHIIDTSVFHKIFKQNTAFTKDPMVYSLGMSNAMTMTIPAHIHKLKRQALDPCFSKQRIAGMEHGLQDEAERFFAKIQEYEATDSYVPIQDLYYCYTGDVISRYLFGTSLNLIESPDFLLRVKKLRSFTRGIWIAIHFPVVRVIMMALPRWLTAFSNDAWVEIVLFCEQLSRQALKELDGGKLSEKKPHEETIFDRMVSCDEWRQQKGMEPPTFQELTDESTSILNAGTEPTATMMAFATYFFLCYPEVRSRLLQELGTIEPNTNGQLSLAKLEGLPYFTAFIRESLRFQPLVPGRLPRTVPKGGLYVPAINATIPEGTVVGISHIFIHEDPDIFESPHEFQPERWMGPEGKKLNQWLCSFSKGRTDCIGQSLAYAEMYVLLGNLFNKFDLELAPGSDRDMEWVDRVIIHPKANLRVKVKTKAKYAQRVME